METLKRYSLKLVKEKTAKYLPTNNVQEPIDIVKLFRVFFKDHQLPVEEFWVACFDNSLKCVGMARLFKGCISESIVGVREIAQFALLCNSTYIAIAHNHPSGNPKASDADLKITRKIQNAMALLDIKLLESLILCSDGIKNGNFVSINLQAI